MPIDTKQLHPLFRPMTVEQKQQKDQLKVWKAIFYTLRGLMWKEACKALREDGLATGVLVYDSDGEVVTEDGNPITVYFNEMREEFNEGYDRTFVNATIEEMVDYALQHFGVGYEELMKMNAERMATFRKREATNPLPPQRPGNAGNPPKAGISPKKPKKPSAPSAESPF